MDTRTLGLVFAFLWLFAVYAGLAQAAPPVSPGAQDLQRAVAAEGR